MEFQAPFGYEYKTVKIGQSAGGSEGYNVLLNNYYEGALFFRKGVWLFYPSRYSIIQGDDVAILVEIIEADGK